MKGLLKYLSPFAPDQSGAVSALYGLGALIVICDAGGCTGNICGFDEPRWFLRQGAQENAIFSAGLRDMDAILGRDERLVEKLRDAADHVDAAFAALIGTPVPAVIATDFGALKQMAQEQTGLPVLTAACTGTRLYDVGEQEAWLELFCTFAKKSAAQSREKNAAEADADGGAGDGGILGVIGCTPLDVSCTDASAALRAYARTQGYAEAYCYGMGAGLAEVKRAGCAAKNLVLTPAGIAAAEYLKETFGTPYETGFPLFGESFQAQLRALGARKWDGPDSRGSGFGGKKILIVHQQVAANAMRDEIAGSSAGAARTACGTSDIVCGTWFLQIPELAQPQDVTFEREEQFAAYVEEGNFDVMIGDPKFRRVLRGWNGEYIDCPHFAVSGILTDEAEEA